MPRQGTRRPYLDCSDILTDPDFVQQLLCVRQFQTVGNDGIAVNAPPLNLKFFGFVTAVRGFELERNPEGQLISGTILIVTRFRLTDGKGDSVAADVVQIGIKQYTVTTIEDYSQYGRGMVQATCTLLPYGGAYPPPPSQNPTFSQR
jgi:galactose-6-phosphate isomerase